MDDVFKFLSDTMQNASERTNDRLKAASLLSELLTAGSESDSDTIKVVVEKKVVDLSGEVRKMREINYNPIVPQPFAPL